MTAGWLELAERRLEVGTEDFFTPSAGLPVPDLFDCALLGFGSLTSDLVEIGSMTQPSGATICTMLLHLGQPKIMPIASGLVTRRSVLHVVHWIWKGFTSGRSKS